jgi:hypothetical protein
MYHVHVIGLVVGHDMVAVDAMEDGVHDRPLGVGRVEAALDILRRRCHTNSATEVGAESNENRGPPIPSSRPLAGSSGTDDPRLSG